ncbi:MAG: peptidoglycan-binding protein [Methanobrevibacter sp.]|nr:peptidoglycan-binding protein [Methanobrevibacter sp.]
MNIKRYLYIMLIFLVLVSLSAVSAADDNANGIISVDDNDELILDEAIDDDVSSANNNYDEELILENPADDLVGSENDATPLKEGATGSFSDLNKLINEDYSSNDTITLNGNYKYSDGDDAFVHGIWIGRGVTIDGNGFTLDGSNSARMFNVNTNNEVIIKNINFINGHATGGMSISLLSGGAIYFGTDSKYANNKVINCNFTNNTAENDGGAIYGIYSGVAINCTFIQNTAKKVYSGALHHFDATNCAFIQNTAKYGGAIFDSTAINCTFINNTAQGAGAMLRGTAVLCRFVEDSDTTSDTNIVTPAFSVSDLTTVYHSGDKLLFNLTANDVNYDGLDAEIKIYKGETPIKTIHALSGSENGWVVDLPLGTYNVVLSLESHPDVEPADATLTVTTDGTTFTDLNELINGNSDDTITLDKNYTYNPDIDSDFKDGVKIYRTVTIIGNGYTIDGAGQARILDLQQGKTTLKNITFKNGSQSFFFGGGAIRCVALVEITNCTFINNHAPSGGAVQLQGWDNVISDCVFIGNTADRGAAIELSAAAYNTITGCVFYDNDIFASQADGCEINNNIFFNSSITFDWTQNYNIDNNWFGNNATNYDEKPVAEDYNIKSWLFLNATADPDTISIIDTSDIIFKLYVYNPNSGDVSEYDSGLLYPVNLNVTAINGTINKNTVKLGEPIIFGPFALGSGSVTASIENATYMSIITVNKIQTEITGNAITATYNVNKDLVITLKDSDGNPVSGVNVTVDLNGAKTYTTDSNGQVKVSTKGLAPKAYTAKITFNGNTNYAKSTKDIKVTVKNATPKLTAKKKTFKTIPKTKKYTIILKDNTGKAIKKAKVTLKVKGKTYKASTNSKGKATFKITKLNKKGTYKATITYKGNKYYKKVSKKAKIKVIVTFKTVSKGSKDKATVKEIQQALKDHGYYLSYKGHYLKVDGKFSSCTFRSVKEFQKDKSLKVTGKVDEKTAHKLGII